MTKPESSHPPPHEARNTKAIDRSVFMIDKEIYEMSASENTAKKLYVKDLIGMKKST